MKDKKVILLFSDLEGTILGEENGNYSEEEMNLFLEQIDRMQKSTNTKIHLHLVSPVFESQMEKVIDKIDTDIIKYNINNKEGSFIEEIEGGSCTQEIGVSQDYKKFQSKVVPFKKPINTKEADASIYGKETYIRSWCDYYKEKGLLKTAIYCGNGRNDVLAMKHVKEKANGFVVCPKNSRPDVKKIADFVSDKLELLGITEGLAKINDEIEKRIDKSIDKTVTTKEKDIDNEIER